ncbi:hypothetical protein ACQBAU_12995 [Propionibacteriaceae bacterium Y2011]
MSLLGQARERLEAQRPHSNRVACWLGRAALEDRITELLARKGVQPGPWASIRSQLSCLEVAYADEPSVATTAQYAWTRLSEGCHQHAYAMSPTYAEVRHLLDRVASLESQSEGAS